MESIFETYKRTVCSICKNKDCDEELRTKIDGSLKCESSERCMKTKCSTCFKYNKCFEEENKYESKSDKQI